MEVERGQRGQVAHPSRRKVMQLVARHRPAKRFHRQLVTDAHRLMAMRIAPHEPARKRYAALGALASGRTREIRAHETKICRDTGPPHPRVRRKIPGQSADRVIDASEDHR